MILTSEDRIAERVKSGAWARLTVDDLLRMAAVEAPDRVAFRDCGEAPVPGVSSTYTYAEAERRVAALAGFLTSIGLRPDTVMGIHLPPCADAAIVILAAMRAGLIVAQLPLHWSNREIETAIGVAGIKAIVTASTIEGEATGERVRDVAGEVFAIRFVFAMGEGLPDGLIDLASIMAEMEAHPAIPAVARRGAAADHIALLSFTRTAEDRLAAVPFSHNHLVGLAAAHTVEAGMARGEAVLVPMHPAGLCGFAGGILSVLAIAGTVAFHYGTTLRTIAAATAAARADRVLAPATLGPSLAIVLSPTVAFSLYDRRVDGIDPPPLPVDRRVVDLTSFGDLTLLPSVRQADGTTPAPRLGALSLASVRPPPGLADLSIKMRSRAVDPRRSVHELTLTGALVPDAPWPEPVSGSTGGVIAFTSDGALRTGIGVQVGADGKQLGLHGLMGETLTVAGQAMSMPRLDELFRRHPSVADAAVFAVPDELVGCRIGVAVVNRPGERLTHADLLDWLSRQGAGSLERPAVVISVPEISRASDGSVMRQALLLGKVA
ncbi:AMP-binding protein [Chthonobacter rhizosphaerae]|uniref:AMP-binding protein n=1 Tax=Chthonobacter rhizosphaerae TaxID=2735553 RepID=UPI0015EFCA04|nr:class I adenylate-forming enzyme family protein [Chthonobacter rhizosphaerae]